MRARTPPQLYQVYGLTLASDKPLATPLHPGHGTPDYWLHHRAEPPIPQEALAALEPLWQSAVTNAAGEAAMRLYRLPDGARLYHYNRVADIRLAGDRIEYAVREPGYDYLIEVALLGPVLSLLLGERGIPALHAAAIQLGAGAAIFLADSRAGKSTLTSFLVGAGGGHISDDIAVLTPSGGGITVQPGYPQVRLWPDSAALLGLDPDAWPRVMGHQPKVRVPVAESGLGSSVTSPVPVSAIYLPQRGDAASPIRIEPIRQGTALTLLMRHLFATALLAACGAPLPVDALAEVVGRVPVRTLHYPTGFERLPALRDALLADLG